MEQFKSIDIEKGRHAVALAKSEWGGLQSLKTAFKGCTLPELTVIDTPWPWPPRKDGSINLGTTDPPRGLSDDDARVLAG